MNAIGQSFIYLAVFMVGAASWIVAERFGVMPDQCLITQDAVDMLGGSTRAR
jgi:hypothetical protein